MMINEEFLNEETSVLTLTDENGVDTDFEYLDTVAYNEVEYLVLIPMDDDDGGVVILRVEPIDEETENYIAVQDKSILRAVYDIFKERYKDILNFVDED